MKDTVIPTSHLKTLISNIPNISPTLHIPTLSTLPALPTLPTLSIPTAFPNLRNRWNTFRNSADHHLEHLTQFSLPEPLLFIIFLLIALLSQYSPTKPTLSLSASPTWSSLLTGLAVFIWKIATWLNPNITRLILFFWAIRLAHHSIAHNLPNVGSLDYTSHKRHLLYVAVFILCFLALSITLIKERPEARPATGVPVTREGWKNQAPNLPNTEFTDDGGLWSLGNGHGGFEERAAATKNFSLSVDWNEKRWDVWEMVKTTLKYSGVQFRRTVKELKKGVEALWKTVRSSRKSSWTCGKWGWERVKDAWIWVKSWKEKMHYRGEARFDDPVQLDKAHDGMHRPPGIRSDATSSPATTEANSSEPATSQRSSKLPTSALGITSSGPPHSSLHSQHPPTTPLNSRSLHTSPTTQGIIRNTHSRIPLSKETHSHPKLELPKPSQSARSRRTMQSGSDRRFRASPPLGYNPHASRSERRPGNSNALGGQAAFTKSSSYMRLSDLKSGIEPSVLLPPLSTPASSDPLPPPVPPPPSSHRHTNQAPPSSQSSVTLPPTQITSFPLPQTTQTRAPPYKESTSNPRVTANDLEPWGPAAYQGESGLSTGVYVLKARAMMLGVGLAGIVSVLFALLGVV